MNDERFDLDGLLPAAAGPPHLPGFDERLEAGLDAADREMGRRSRTWFQRRAALLRPRRALVVALTAVAVCAVVAGAVLVGLPVSSPVTGPEPVSAAVVVQRMLHALATTDTLEADSRVLFRGVDSDGTIRYSVQDHHVFWRSDGSTRFILLDGPQQGPLRLRDRPDENDFAYDAVRGTFYDYVRGWDSDVGPDGSYLDRFVVTRHYPIGPPDAPVTVTGYDFSATARAQVVARQATVVTTEYQGRPAWVIRSSTTRILGPVLNEESLKRWTPPVSGDEVGLTTVDRQTGLPVRFQVVVGGVLQFEYSWSDIKVDQPLPADAFTVRPPKGTRLIHRDAGFRRLPLTVMAARAPRTTLVPEWLPVGYRKAGAAYARTSVTSNQVTYGRQVVALRYERGFDNLTVTARVVGNAAMAQQYDPVMDDTAWADLVSREVRLTGGPFEGATARVVVGPRVTTPHLWVVKGGVMLTVAGGASVRELLAIAESVRPYATQTTAKSD